MDNGGAYVATVCSGDCKWLALTVSACFVQMGFWSGHQPKVSLITPGQPTSGLHLTFTNGSPCIVGNTTQPRVVNVLLACAPNPAPQRFDITEEGNCRFTIRFAQHYTCPVSQAGCSDCARAHMLLLSVRAAETAGCAH